MGEFVCLERNNILSNPTRENYKNNNAYHTTKEWSSEVGFPSKHYLEMVILEAVLGLACLAPSSLRLQPPTSDFHLDLIPQPLDCVLKYSLFYCLIQKSSSFF
jgi:hypothetical protein